MHPAPMGALKRGVAYRLGEQRLVIRGQGRAGVAAAYQ